VNLTVFDLRAINRAIREAHRSEHRVRVGAVVVYKKNISAGCNKIRNSPLINWQNASVHAEIAALRKAPNNGRGSTLYVVRLGSRGALLPSFPCERCLPEISDAKVRRLVWWDGTKWVKQVVPRL
jgi:tRNA(Arg) A34 adenosine deaminase TadA